MNPAQKVLARAMTEAELLRQVENLAHFHGWLSYHTWNSRNSASGFPDLVMVRQRSPRRALFVELKSQTGRLTKAQQQWADGIEGLAAQGVVDYFIWRPADLISGTIEAGLE